MNPQQMRLVPLVGALAICCLGTHLRSGGQETNELEIIKELYAYQAWAGQTKVKYHQPVTNWVPDFASLGVTNFLWRAEGIWTNGQKSSGYRFESPEATGVRVELRVWERADVTNAQLAMLEAFTFCAAWQPFPLGPSVGVDVGDRCYVGWGPPEQWIVFVRNNVCVYLAAYPEGSVLSLAHRLDSDLTARSFAGPVLLEVGRAGQALRVSTPTAVGRLYVLEFAETLDGASWTELTRFTGDGTIRQLAVPIHGPRRFFRLRVQ